MMRNAETGFGLYLANAGVVHAAVRRLQVWPGQADYDDLVEEGMLIYVAYYQRYRDPVRTQAERIKFNKLAGLFVYYGLLKIVTREQRRPAVHERSARREPPADSDPQDWLVKSLDEGAEVALLARLRRQLTPREQAVFETMVDQAFTRAETRAYLGLSQSNLTNVLRRIHAKYQTLKAAEAVASSV